MPSAPPAPARFSTTTDCFSSRPSASATGRATVSATPPGGNGTIIVIGRSGHDCACAAAATTGTSEASSRERSVVWQTRMQKLLRFADISIADRTGASMITLTSRASLSRALVCALAAVAAAAPASAQDAYPSKPVRIIVPFAAGGPADVYARFLAERLQQSMGQTFVVDDRPGAGSIIGTDAVAKSAPDGYTLLLMSNTHTVNESLIATKPFQ